ncbi:hypothetical protein BXO88_06940 [Oribacterium sp. C9]|uniref:thioesterase family protein n=1 Tax=Oribacterium sp. C9 TaxID=1943579 RepID=UPI00098ED63D|nr:thioesterase family protein [Oribacterium sp. C9]OON86721.1 hypothetical protein BXO88_06940 [Oribacterium sp. C9]
MIETGMTLTQDTIVTKEMTAAAIGGKDAVMALGTPFLVGLCEDTAVKLMKPELEEGQGSVGTTLSINHKAPTPVGMKLSVTVTVTEVDRKRIEFDFVAKDEAEEVATGHHQRFIINNDKFLQGVNKKAALVEKA